MSMKWKINLLGLAGAIIGIVAIFSRWIGVSIVGFNLIDVINLVNSEVAPQDYRFASILVIVGTIIALVSPLGGVLQIIGAPWFILVWANRHDGQIISSVGPYLAIASAIIVLASIVRPMGLGLMRGPFPVRSRLLVFSIAGTPIAGEETPEGKEM
jgi:hypothetical protein